MNEGFLSRILPVCPHQFTWPRRDENGEYYQLCVNCGSRYDYDWSKMRRTAKSSGTAEVPPATHRCNQKKVKWTPRERRLKHEVPLLYRLEGTKNWMEARSENVSKSGLLFRSPDPLEEGDRLEVKLELPRELTGETPAEVICHATVARVMTVAPAGKMATHLQVACSVSDYDFAKPMRRAGFGVIDIQRRKQG